MTPPLSPSLKCAAGNSFVALSYSPRHLLSRKTCLRLCCIKVKCPKCETDQWIGVLWHRSFVFGFIAFLCVMWTSKDQTHGRVNLLKIMRPKNNFLTRLLDFMWLTLSEDLSKLQQVQNVQRIFKKSQNVTILQVWQVLDKSQQKYYFANLTTIQNRRWREVLLQCNALGQLKVFALF